jgi:uncharacterized protein (DUF2147 family)
MKKSQTIARSSLVIAALCIGAGVQSQMTPVGNWHTIDDKTGEVKSLILVTETNGVISGRIDKLLRKDADQKGLCKECTDERKDKPMLGLEIIRGAKKVADKEVWEGGKILDPENGKEYTLRMTPIEAGKKLEVRGSIAFFGRTQTWVRVP